MPLDIYNWREARRKKEAALAAVFPQGIQCQKCLQYGHWTYECKIERKIKLFRFKRTQVLKKNLKPEEEGRCSNKKCMHKCKIPNKKHGNSDLSSSSSDSAIDSSESSSGSDSNSNSSCLESDSDSGSESGSDSDSE